LSQLTVSDIVAALLYRAVPGGGGILGTLSSGADQSPLPTRWC
jgi:hypothetical protein